MDALANGFDAMSAIGRLLLKINSYMIPGATETLA